MSFWLRRASLAALLSLPLATGCVVQREVVRVPVAPPPGPPPGAPPPPACRAVWVRAHYDRYGAFHYGHWRCVS